MATFFLTILLLHDDLHKIFGATTVIAGKQKTTTKQNKKTEYTANQTATVLPRLYPYNH